LSKDRCNPLHPEVCSLQWSLWLQGCRAQPKQIRNQSKSVDHGIEGGVIKKAV
jgi:hypothetical protein